MKIKNGLILSLGMMLGVSMMALGNKPADYEGFYTDGTMLRDANGNEFLMRGLNYSYGWQTDLNWVIKSTHDWGCNAIRINIGDGSYSDNEKKKLA